MSTPPLMHDRAYFTEMYADDPDPWKFDTSWYERRKFAVTIAALPRERYRRAFEPGCANGALTALLADRCHELVAGDVIPAVVTHARERLAGTSHVEVRRAEFPIDWPDGRGDLVVLSEIAYYLTDEGVAVAEAGLQRWLEPGGHLLAVHYTGTTDYPRHGAAVAEWLDAVPWLERLVTIADPSFELGVWRRT